MKSNENIARKKCSLVGLTLLPFAKTQMMLGFDASYRIYIINYTDDLFWKITAACKPARNIPEMQLSIQIGFNSPLAREHDQMIKYWPKHVT